MIREHYDNREDWLARKMHKLSATEASVASGHNPWMTADELFDIKTGRKPPKDLDDNEAVQYGKNVEQHIRSIVALDYDQFEIQHHEFDILCMDEYPHISATLDGEMIGRKSRGVLEIKSGSYRTEKDLEQWRNGKIPMHYFCQVVQQLMVTEYDFNLVATKLKKQIYKKPSNPLLPQVQEVTWVYTLFDARDVNIRSSMESILYYDNRFWERVQAGVRPETIIHTQGDTSWNKARW